MIGEPLSLFIADRLFNLHTHGYNLSNSQRYTLMAEDAVESAGAKAPAITILTQQTWKRLYRRSFGRNRERCRLFDRAKIRREALTPAERPRDVVWYLSPVCPSSVSYGDSTFTGVLKAPSSRRQYSFADDSHTTCATYALSSAADKL